ncbi:MAG TPA: hypothetical protein VIM93_06945 [Kangiella sp.]
MSRQSKLGVQILYIGQFMNQPYLNLLDLMNDSDGLDLTERKGYSVRTYKINV